MKIMVTSEGDNMESQVDPKFRRCKFLLIVDLDTMACEAISNEEIASGAGIKAAQLTAQKAVSVVLSGNVGPNAFQVLNAAKIRIVRAEGNVRDALDKFRKGELEEVSSPSVGGHFGR